MNCEAVILAAGLGTRMRSDLPKVLHLLGGKPMLSWVVATCTEAVGRQPWVVVGPEQEAMVQMLGERARFAVQAEPLGTGHALLQAQRAVGIGADLVLVVNGDMPLLRKDTLCRLIEAQQSNEGPATLLTVTADSSLGFGRVLRDRNDRILAVVEEAHASAEQLAIREFNAGAYCFRTDWLWNALSLIKPSPKGEYYLTDLIGLAVGEGKAVSAVRTPDLEETIGINTLEHLAQAEAVLQKRINRRWMLEGVTFQDPATAYIGPAVRLGRDTMIMANTHLEGRTVVGSGCRLGPNTIVRDSSIGDRCTVEASVLEGAELEQDIHVGPFTHLRRGARLARGVRLGNFCEVKNSTLGPGVKAGHFCYLGDAEIGPAVNIGAGTITCNYDGDRKHKTIIGEGAFIGSDTMLVAPVVVGRGSRTGAGAVVTKDVPEDSVAVGIPARVIRKLSSSNE